MILNKIVSGAQTGADLAGIDAAIACNVDYDGWIPKGRKTETGRLSDSYIMREMPTGSYPKRTEKNVMISDGTIIFTHNKLSGGSRLTLNKAIYLKKPVLHFNLTQSKEADIISFISQWLSSNNIKTLNIAGSRASKDPAVYDKVFSIVKGIIENAKN